MKWVLLITVSLFAIGLLAAGYVWYKFSQVNIEIGLVEVVETPVEEPEMGVVSVDTPEIDLELEAATDENIGVVSEPVVVSKESLPEEQQEVLEKVGLDETEFVITPDMIACAEEKLGLERMIEIRDGATPSFVEGVALLTCI